MSNSFNATTFPKGSRFLIKISPERDFQEWEVLEYSICETFVKIKQDYLLYPKREGDKSEFWWWKVADINTAVIIDLETIIHLEPSNEKTN